MIEHNRSLEKYHNLWEERSDSLGTLMKKVIRKREGQLESRRKGGSERARKESGELSMKANKNPLPKGQSPSQEIDAIIRETEGWRGKTLSQLRALINQADLAVVEEVKWKKPSRPMGVPVWSHDGIVCIADTLKNAVRLTFPKGAQLKDPTKLFNTRLESNTVRAIDFHEGDTVDEAALKALILEAAGINSRKRAGGK